MAQSSLHQVKGPQLISLADHMGSKHVQRYLSEGQVNLIELPFALICSQLISMADNKGSKHVQRYFSDGQVNLIELPFALICSQLISMADHKG